MTKLSQSQITSMMDDVLHVRYSDLVLSKSYCETLLSWGKKHHDELVIAFSLTYFADYYFTTGENAVCLTNLIKARDIATKESDNALLVRIYSLFGLYYDAIAYEQSSLQYYM